MANYDLFIFAGHGEGDCGAVGNGYQEHERCVALAKKVVSILQSKGLKVHYGIQNYNNNLTKGNTYSKKFGFSFHLNSSTSKSAKGIEIIVPLTDKNLSMETEIINEMAKLGFTNRGLKSRDYNTEAWSNRTNGKALSGTDYYGEIRNAKSNGVSLSIIESCFISNADDIKRFNSNIDKIATIYANAILKYCGVSTSSTTSSNSSSSTSAYVDGCKVKVLSGAIYGGLSSTKGTKVPSSVIGNTYTATRFAINGGSHEGLLSGINSWIPINYLQVVSSATYHTVAKGDTLYGIASKYSTTVAKIQSLNGMGSSTIISVGQKLRVK